MNTLLALKQRIAKASGDMRAILEAAKAENRDLNAEEAKKYDEIKATLMSAQQALAREEETAAFEKLSATSTVATAAVDADKPRMPVVVMGQDRKELDKTRGFSSLGEFCVAVYHEGENKNPFKARDDRLRFDAAAPSTFGSEGVGADGGFLVPPQFASEIFQLALTDHALLPLTDQTVLNNTNSMVFPKDETTPWGSNGVRAYWQAEAGAATPTKPVLGVQTMRLHKLMALVPLSDELVADSTAAGSYMAPLMARSINWKTNEAILLGTGAGQPLGLLANAGNVGSCAVVQAKDSGQATLTLTATNLANMIARLPPGAYGDAIWLIGPDVLPSLFTLTLGNYPIYLPGGTTFGGITVSPYGQLLGRPVMVSQHVGAFSAQGDVSLIVPNWYRTITAGSVQIAQSLHLYFDADATAFRAIFRMDGSPKISAPIAQAKGSKTLSPAIQLQAR